MLATVFVALCLLVLLLVANGMPVLLRRLLGRRYAMPIDGGRLWRDGRPILGSSKTWRGLFGGSLGCGFAAQILGQGFLFGAAFGLLALLGDLFSSFCKRRLGLGSSARATVLDQLPEALLPMLLAVIWLDVGWLVLVVVSLAFMLVDILVSPFLHRLGIRHQPH
ncbi:CDP-archaeol synthase [Marinobacter sp.]|uniref:CDP-archaeol synthase n=1 Tax=Marinobacter sp. TaxID=50741 RepID=UPI0038507815